MTTIHRKPTDLMLLLHYQSNHPLHTKESIIYSQALRYNIIINSKNEGDRFILNFTISHGLYSLANIINRNILIALNHSRHDLFHKTRQNQQRNNHFLPYGIYENDHNLKNSINSNWHLFTEDDTLQTILPHKPTASLKRNTTLGNILVRSDTT